MKMTKQEFKQALYDIFDASIEGMEHDEKCKYIEKLAFDYQRDRDEHRQKPNSRKPWKDEELFVILSDAPTVENCVKYARLFGRGYGSIEQIYRWAATSLKDIQSKREDDVFVKQVKRIAKELGRRA